jgi:hypothetical protein
LIPAKVMFPFLNLGASSPLVAGFMGLRDIVLN